MKSSYDAIYLAPHLDDVALSCGGQVFARTTTGQQVLVVTVMAGSPPPSAQSGYIDSLHARWELAGDAAAERRAEDVAACALLGADYLHLSIPDCIYRFHPQSGAPLYVSDDDIFGDVHGAEASLQASLVEELRQLPPAGEVYAPLTVGHHVDHLLVRTAAEAVWQDSLHYYEDYPYAQVPAALVRVLGDGTAWRSRVVSLDAAALHARYDAIWAFRSQMSTFFGSREDMEEQVGDFVRATGGERTWQIER